jgi:hypothetical protein
MWFINPCRSAPILVEPNKLPPKELSLIQELIECYPSIKYSNPSAWVVFSYDYKHTILHSGEVCHASMQYHDSNLYDCLVTAVPKKDPLSIKYQEFLINGPFRAYSDKITLESIKLTEKSDLEYYIKVTDLDKWPSNVVYNYCIATRVPIEHDELLKPWDKLCEVGVDPTLAFMIVVGNHAWGQKKPLNDLSILQTKLMDVGSVSRNHFWYDVTADWNLLLSGEMAEDGVSKLNFKESPATCRPTNRIWGRNPNRALIGLTVLELMERFGRPLNVPIADRPKRAPRKSAKVEIAELDHIVEQAIAAPAGPQPGLVVPPWPAQQNVNHVVFDFDDPDDEPEAEDDDDPDFL